MRVIQYSRDIGDKSRKPRRTGSPACAGDDESLRGGSVPHIIPTSSSSAFSISSSLSTMFRRGTRKNIVAAQAIESANIADVSGNVVVEWPPR
jgi:hypothetical protein